MLITLFLPKSDDFCPFHWEVLGELPHNIFCMFPLWNNSVTNIISSITEAPRSEPQDRDTSKMCSGGHVVAQTPADTWSLEPEDDVDVEECRLRPAGPRSMLGWKPTCLRACLVRWSLRMKHLSQSGHMKRFSPVCVRKCRVSSSDRENFFAQSGHVHWKGLSPKNGERNVRLLLFQDFQPQLRKTASGKQKHSTHLAFFPCM